MPPEFVRDPRRSVGVVDADVDVEAGGGIAVLWVLDPVELFPVPRFPGVVKFAPDCNGVETGACDPIALCSSVVNESVPYLTQSLIGGQNRVDGRGLCLDGELEQFVVQSSGEWFRRLGPIHEVVYSRGRSPLLVDDKELLFDP
jgi:hypothetical protein